MENLLLLSVLTILITLGGGAVLLLIPRTRKHYLGVVIISSIIFIAILSFYWGRYSTRIVNDTNRVIETKKPSEIKDPLNETTLIPLEPDRESNIRIQQENQTHLSEINSNNNIQQQTISAKSDDELDNEVQHKGYLTIRVLENSQPIAFVNYYVSCAKNEQQDPNDKKRLAQEVFIGDFNGTAFINCKINNDRWLLDTWKNELKMPNTDIEINGKIIPDKYIIKTANGLSANYIVKLLRIN